MTGVDKSYPLLRKGHIFVSPDHMEGYILKCDVGFDAPIAASDFKPIGKAKKPKAGGIMPEWLVEQIMAVD